MAVIALMGELPNWSASYATLIVAPKVNQKMSPAFDGTRQHPSMSPSLPPSLLPCPC